MTSVKPIYHNHNFQRDTQVPVVFCKKGVLKIVRKFTGKNLCQGLCMIKLQASDNTRKIYLHDEKTTSCQYSLPRTRQEKGEV